MTTPVVSRIPRLTRDQYRKLPADVRLKVKSNVLQIGRLDGTWLRDPAGWVELALGGWVSAQQRQLMETVRDHPKVVVPAAHSVGKSKTAARLSCWWIDAHPPGSALVVTSAPTFRQVRAVVWREIRREHRAGRLDGRMNQVEWVSRDGDICAFGAKPSDYDPAAWQGFHAQFVLVVLDEAAGVAAELWDQAERLTTGPQHRLLAIGNPDYQGSYFHSMTSEPGWHTVTLSALDSPAFTDEEPPEDVAMSLVSKTWVDERAERFGIGSPTWMRQVSGEFPPQREGGIIPRPWLTQCAHPDTFDRAVNILYVRPTKVPVLWGRNMERVQLGVDVAGGGGDMTVIRERRGLTLGRRWQIDSDDSEKIVDLVIDAATNTGASMIVVDSIGVGFGVLGSLRRRLTSVPEMGSGKTLEVRVEGFNAAEAADPSPEQTWPSFANKRAQLWWMGRELSRQRLWDTTLIFYDTAGRVLRDDLTADDLCAPLWEEKKGLVVVESKDDVRAEIKRSPDDGDAALLAYWQPARMRARIAAVPTAQRPTFNAVEGR